MSIIRRGKDTFLVRVYLGREATTKKRLEVNETVRGSLSLARKVESTLKERKYSGRLTKSPKMSLDTLVNLYLDSIRHTLSLSTHVNYESAYNRYARPYIGQIPISQVRTSDIKKLFNFLQDKKEVPVTYGEKGTQVTRGLGLSRSSVGAVKNVLIGAFNLAVDDCLIPANPASNAKVRSPKKHSAVSLTVEEATAFVSVKDNFWHGNALVFQLHTGLRNQELMALIWDDVNFDEGTLRIERACKWVKNTCVELGCTKTVRSTRLIKLEPEHLELLRLQFERQQGIIEKRKKLRTWYGDRRVDKWVREERPRQSHLYTRTNLIFPKTDGNAPTSDSVRKQFRAMLRSAGIEDRGRHIRWYDLRHTHASFLVGAGLPLADIAERMGHSVETLVRIYTHSVGDGPRSPSRTFADLIPT